MFGNISNEIAIYHEPVKYKLDQDLTIDNLEVYLEVINDYLN